MAKLRWGILGSGKIANKFASELSHSRTGQLVAVGSRDIARAEGFAKRHDCDPANYDDLFDSTNVDAVYISLPNSLHAKWSAHGLSCGKHILCEKPLAISAQEAEQLFAVATENNRTLVEAFMYRGNPAIDKFLELVHSGTIGEPKIIRTHFTFNRDPNPQDVRYQADLCGGSIMDVGCYCVNLTRAITRSEPDEVSAFASKVHGVDQYAAGTLRFGETIATFTCGMTVSGDRTTFVGGSEGYLAIDTPWFSDGKITVCCGRLPHESKVETLQVDVPEYQYAHQADRFAATVDGQAPVISAEDSVGNADVLQRLRRTIGLS